MWGRRRKPPRLERRREKGFRQGGNRGGEEARVLRRGTPAGVLSQGEARSRPRATEAEGAEGLTEGTKGKGADRHLRSPCLQMTEGSTRERRADAGGCRNPPAVAGGQGARSPQATRHPIKGACRKALNGLFNADKGRR